MENVMQSILVVDDSRLNLQMIKDILGTDHQIHCATSGKEALTIIMSKRVDLILLDVIMPEMDGFELCKLIKSNPQTQNIPVIFVSYRDEVEDQARGLEIGAIDFITKPVNPSIIKARVKNHLELKRYRDMLEELSTIDGLTGIANRRYLDEVLEKEWRRALRTGDILAVILIDIDYFKKYNDCYGHVAGDECLRKVAKALKDSVKRAGELVARYGGEEFVVVLRSVSKEDALKLGEILRQDVESLNILHAQSEVSRYVTISAGVAAVIPNRELLYTSLFSKADNALYQAKEKGRNKVSGENVKRINEFKPNLVSLTGY
jgi:diguanylate cyclase (GGDEF)-like protein